MVPGGTTAPVRKPGEPAGRGQHHAAHCGMLEKRAAVHRPIAHGGLLVEMTGWGNGAKLAATRDSRPAMHQIIGGRSEEHTSELQSQSNLVCRLLLEKKKQRKPNSVQTTSSRVNSNTE